MPGVEFTTTTKLPIETLWSFVQEMDNWAGFVQGYVGHAKQSETESTWTLKGDVGVLTRTVHFQVHVTEWNGPERVTFELEGTNEPVKGSGSFTLRALDEQASSSPPAPRESAWVRFKRAIFRWLYRLVVRGVERKGSDASSVLSEKGVRSESGVRSQLSFRLELEPGGPMAPMVNALLKPLMLPAAEDLANRIIAHLEERERPT